MGCIFRHSCNCILYSWWAIEEDDLQLLSVPHRQSSHSQYRYTIPLLHPNTDGTQPPAVRMRDEEIKEKIMRSEAACQESCRWDRWTSTSRIRPRWSIWNTVSWIFREQHEKNWELCVMYTQLLQEAGSHCYENIAVVLSWLDTR